MCKFCGQIFAGTFFVAMVVLTTAAIYWLLFDNAPLVVQKQAEWVNAEGAPLSQARSGEIAYIRRETCGMTRIAIPITTGRRLIRDGDTIAFPMPSSTGFSAPGCVTRTYAFQLPRMPPGRYNYISTVTYAQNPLTDTVIILPAPPLDVVP